jgi:hypothetical protein
MLLLTLLHSRFKAFASCSGKEKVSVAPSPAGTMRLQSPASLCQPTEPARLMRPAAKYRTTVPTRLLPYSCRTVPVTYIRVALTVQL